MAFVFAEKRQILSNFTLCAIPLFILFVFLGLNIHWAQLPWCPENVSGSTLNPWASHWCKTRPMIWKPYKHCETSCDWPIFFHSHRPYCSEICTTYWSQKIYEPKSDDLTFETEYIVIISTIILTWIFMILSCICSPPPQPQNNSCQPKSKSNEIINLISNDCYIRNISSHDYVATIELN